MSDVKGVDSAATHFHRTLQVDRIMNLSTHHALSSRVPNSSQIFFAVQSDKFEQRKDLIFNNLHHLTWVKRRPEWSPGEHRVNLGKTLCAEEALMPAGR